MSDLSGRQCEFTHALALLIIKVHDSGYQCKIQELNRLFETQQKYVAVGVSKTLDSRHLDLLAADIVLFKDGAILEDAEAYRPFGEYWEQLGGRWGGRFGLESESKDTQNEKIGWDPFHMEFRK